MSSPHTTLHGPPTPSHSGLSHPHIWSLSTSGRAEACAASSTWIPLPQTAFHSHPSQELGSGPLNHQPHPRPRLPRARAGSPRRQESSPLRVSAMGTSTDHQRSHRWQSPWLVDACGSGRTGRRWPWGRPGPRQGWELGGRQPGQAVRRQWFGPAGKGSLSWPRALKPNILH